MRYPPPSLSDLSPRLPSSSRPSSPRAGRPPARRPRPVRRADLVPVRRSGVAPASPTPTPPSAEPTASPAIEFTPGGAGAPRPDPSRRARRLHPAVGLTLPVGSTAGVECRPAEGPAAEVGFYSVPGQPGGGAGVLRAPLRARCCPDVGRLPPRRAWRRRLGPRRRRGVARERRAVRRRGRRLPVRGPPHWVLRLGWRRERPGDVRRWSVRRHPRPH